MCVHVHVCACMCVHACVCVCVCNRTEGMIGGVRMGMCYVILSMCYLKHCCFGMFAFYVHVIYSFDILVC